jgi:hypothetical protein
MSSDNLILTFVEYEDVKNLIDDHTMYIIYNKKKEMYYFIGKRYHGVSSRRCNSYKYQFKTVNDVIDFIKLITNSISVKWSLHLHSISIKEYDSLNFELVNNMLDTKHELVKKDNYQFKEKYAKKLLHLLKQ